MGRVAGVRDPPELYRYLEPESHAGDFAKAPFRARPGAEGEVKASRMPPPAFSQELFPQDMCVVVDTLFELGVGGPACQINKGGEDRRWAEPSAHGAHRRPRSAFARTDPWPCPILGEHLFGCAKSDVLVGAPTPELPWTEQLKVYLTGPDLGMTDQQAYTLILHLRGGRNEDRMVPVKVLAFTSVGENNGKKVRFRELAKIKQSPRPEVRNLYGIVQGWKNKLKDVSKLPPNLLALRHGLEQLLERFADRQRGVRVAREPMPLHSVAERLGGILKDIEERGVAPGDAARTNELMDTVDALRDRLGRLAEDIVHEQLRKAHHKPFPLQQHDALDVGLVPVDPALVHEQKAAQGALMAEVRRSAKLPRTRAASSAAPCFPPFRCG